MIVYHYARIDEWATTRQAELLVARSPLKGGHPEAKRLSAIFALPEPLPTSWIENPRFPNYWDLLKNYMGKMLLEITLDPSDMVGVVDYAHIANMDDLPEPSMETLFSLHKLRADAAAILETGRKYWDTRVSIDEYLNNPSRFSLPEIIILNSVPCERFRISPQQPLIEKTIRNATESGNDSESRQLLEQLRMGIPELQPWIAPCEATLRTQRSGKEII